MIPATYKVIGLLNIAIRRQQVFVVVPYSSEVLLMLKIFRSEGFITSFSFLPNSNTIRVFPAYCGTRPVLKQIFPISTPGRRTFTSVAALKFFLSRLGFFLKQRTFLVLFRTSYGICTHYQLLRMFIGGQPICIAFI